MKPPRFHRRFDYDRRLLPNAHLAKLEEGVTSIEEARLSTGATIGYPGWGLIYYLLLSHLDPSKASERIETVVETGTNFGCSTIVLAQAIRDSGAKGHVYSFELDPANVAIARRNVEAAGLSDIVTIVEGDTRNTLPDFFKHRSSTTLRFAYLDASHLYEDVLSEFERILPHLTSDALVLFDNTYQIAERGEDPRVNGTLRTILARHGGNLINVEFVSWFTPGLAVWQKSPNL